MSSYAYLQSVRNYVKCVSIYTMIYDIYTLLILKINEANTYPMRVVEDFLWIVFIAKMSEDLIHTSKNVMRRNLFKLKHMRIYFS